MDTPFVSGWDPEIAKWSLEAMPYRRMQLTAAAFPEDEPIPPAMSLSQFVLWPHNQGASGTCWANSATQAFQIMTAAEGVWEPVQLARMAVCYGGSKLANWRSPDDGNSCLNGLLAMSDEEGGIGVCHELLWPFPTPDHSRTQMRSYLNQYLGKSPPDGVTADANPNRVHQIAPTKTDDDRRRAIKNGHPVDIGISWGGQWDSARSMIDFAGTTWGPDGHAVLLTGYALPGVWDDYDWYELHNSHGPIYPPLDAGHAAKTPGYKATAGDRTHTTWVRGDYMRAALGGRSGEQYVAASMTGFKRKTLPLDYSDAFPV